MSYGGVCVLGVGPVSQRIRSLKRKRRRVVSDLSNWLSTARDNLNKELDARRKHYANNMTQAQRDAALIATLQGIYFELGIANTLKCHELDPKGSSGPVTPSNQ